MHNLVGISPEISRLQIRVELAQAGIPAFGVWPSVDSEVEAEILGVLLCPLGSAEFTRASIYWIVALSEPLSYEAAQRLNQSWSKEVRVNGHAGGTEPSFEGVRAYHVDSQAGLDELVLALTEQWGTPKTHFPEEGRRSNRVSSFTSAAKPSLNWMSASHMPAPETKSDLAQLQISALSLLGGIQNDPCYHLRLAWEIAFDTFGADSDQVQSVRKEIASTLRHRIIRLRLVLNHGRNDSRDLYAFTWLLEEALTERAHALRSLSRVKEARSVEQECDEVRTRLVGLMQAELDNYSSRLKAADTGLDNNNEIDVPYCRFEQAATTMSLARLQNRRDKRVEAARLYAEALRLAESLDKKYAAQFFDRAKNRFSK